MFLNSKENTTVVCHVRFLALLLFLFYNFLEFFPASLCFDTVLSEETKIVHRRQKGKTRLTSKCRINCCFLFVLFLFFYFTFTRI